MDDLRFCLEQSYSVRDLRTDLDLVRLVLRLSRIGRAGLPQERREHTAIDQPMALMPGGRPQPVRMSGW